MKQLTIFANRDLEPQVFAVLDGAGVEAFLRVGEATGNRFLPEGEVPRTVTWEAVMVVVPALDEAKVEPISRALARIASDCGVEPCLRVVTTRAEVVV